MLVVGLISSTLLIYMMSNKIEYNVSCGDKLTTAALQEVFK